jgi:hypothetical protein
MEILKMFCPREVPLASDKANKFLFSLFLILLLPYFPWEQGKGWMRS